jgi:hypothetical protein
MHSVASKRGISENDKNCFCDCSEDPSGSQIGAAQWAAIGGIPVQEGRFRRDGDTWAFRIAFADVGGGYLLLVLTPL